LNVLPKEKRMTIAAGFCGTDGILLGADTLHTGTGVNLHNAKLFTAEAECGKMVMSFAGHPEFAEATIQKCAHALQSATPQLAKGHAGIAAIVSRVVESEYRRVVYKRPDRSDAHVYRLLFGIWSPDDGLGLYSTWETSIKRHEEYACLGVGEYLGHYLIRPTYHPGMRVAEIAISATYAIAKAKDYVEGCGGDTNFKVLKSDGSLGDISWHITEPIERAIKEYERQSKAFLLSLLDSDQTFRESMKRFASALRSLRRDVGSDDANERGLVKRWRSLFENPGAPQ
jgi:hypothetical protein